VRRGLGRRAAGPPASSPHRRPSACLPSPRRSDEFLILLALGWSARDRAVVGAGLVCCSWRPASQRSGRRGRSSPLPSRLPLYRAEGLQGWTGKRGAGSQLKKRGPAQVRGGTPEDAGGEQGVGFAGNYCKDDTSGIFGPEASLALRQGSGLRQPLHHRSCHLEKLREEAWRGRTARSRRLRTLPVSSRPGHSPRSPYGALGADEACDQGISATIRQSP
jgi:hypothetical protein